MSGANAPVTDHRVDVYAVDIQSGTQIKTFVGKLDKLLF